MIIKSIHQNLYKGKGEKRNKEMPLFDGIKDDPKDYVASDNLRDAVNVAISMGMPLLLTGEPGTGKTQLAYSVAYELGLPGPFIFNTKTTSTATDLFYKYDALRRFQDIQLKEEKTTGRYFSYEALGKAILLATPVKDRNFEHYDEDLKKYSKPTRSIILIDEIDKAPRDLPNDILNEIENMEFRIWEIDKIFKAEQKYRPIVFMTSNSEKNLPDAFLRRCAFYHIDFPEDDELKLIAQRRFGKLSEFMTEFIDIALEHFNKISDMDLKKNPGTAEFLAWINILEFILDSPKPDSSKPDSPKLDMNNLTPEQEKLISLSYTVLVKNKEDLETLKESLK